jgi:hypothetical protein
MDPESGSRRAQQRLTNGHDTWSARCGVIRTPGAGGDLRETASGNTAPRPQVYLTTGATSKRSLIAYDH